MNYWNLFATMNSIKAYVTTLNGSFVVIVSIFFLFFFFLKTISILHTFIWPPHEFVIDEISFWAEILIGIIKIVFSSLCGLYKKCANLKCKLCLIKYFIIMFECVTYGTLTISYIFFIIFLRFVCNFFLSYGLCYHGHWIKCYDNRWESFFFLLFLFCLSILFQCSFFKFFFFLVRCSPHSSFNVGNFNFL